MCEYFIPLFYAKQEHGKTDFYQFVLNRIYQTFKKSVSWQPDYSESEYYDTYEQAKDGLEQYLKANPTIKGRDAVGAYNLSVSISGFFNNGDEQPYDYFFLSPSDLKAYVSKLFRPHKINMLITPSIAGALENFAAQVMRRPEDVTSQAKGYYDVVFRAAGKEAADEFNTLLKSLYDEKMRIAQENVSE